MGKWNGGGVSSCSVGPELKVYYTVQQRGRGNSSFLYTTVQANFIIYKSEFRWNWFKFLFCRTVGSQDALQEAKRVISEEYSVVGLLEHMDLSLTLMEALVPRFFTGALHIYRKMSRGVLLFFIIVGLFQTWLLILNANLYFDINWERCDF